MPAAPLPEDELWRLISLWDLKVPQGARDDALDAIVHAAALVCGSPVGLVSLVDEHRQWFPAVYGMPGVTETPRDVAFCAHAILGNGILEVENAAVDARFADNPLVTGAPKIRSYAGAPLVLTDGTKIGTLCTIDQAPKKLDERQRTVLLHLAHAVAALLEQRKAAQMAQG